MRVSALGFDTEKGLMSGPGRGDIAGTKLSTPTFNGEPLTDLHLRHWSAGDDAGFSLPSFNDKSWDSRDQPFPLKLAPGEVVWYRTVLRDEEFPDPEVWNGPLNLRLEGRNAKANVYLNGRLIGMYFIFHHHFLLLHQLSFIFPLF